MSRLFLVFLPEGPCTLSLSLPLLLLFVLDIESDVVVGYGKLLYSTIKSIISFLIRFFISFRVSFAFFRFFVFFFCLFIE